MSMSLPVLCPDCKNYRLEYEMRQRLDGSWTCSYCMLGALRTVEPETKSQAQDLVAVGEMLDLFPKPDYASLPTPDSMGEQSGSFGGAGASSDWNEDPGGGSFSGGDSSSDSSSSCDSSSDSGNCDSSSED